MAEAKHNCRGFCSRNWISSCLKSTLLVQMDWWLQIARGLARYQQLIQFQSSLMLNIAKTLSFHLKIDIELPCYHNKETETGVAILNEAQRWMPAPNHWLLVIKVTRNLYFWMDQKSYCFLELYIKIF